VTSLVNNVREVVGVVEGSLCSPHVRSDEGRSINRVGLRMYKSVHVNARS
jgi:hypothetical protein